MKLRTPFVFLLTLSVILTSFVLSQTSSTSLRGTVTDPSGSVVSGATVTLENTESNTKRTVTTSIQGDYQFLFLPPGTYSLTVTTAGFERYEQTGLQLLVANESELEENRHSSKPPTL
jgi:hypothetical protein